jgi:DNA-binding NarL/FixJ family response regulator
MPTRASWTLPRRLHLQHATQAHSCSRRDPSNATIRVAVVEDHPSPNTGLEAILATDGEMRLVGTASSEEDLWPLLRRARPDVLVVGTSGPPREALQVCLSVAGRRHAPCVVLYGPSDDDGAVAVAATLAGASAVVASSTPPARLLGTIRAVARLAQSIPPVSLKMKRDAAEMLDPADHAILAMRLAGEPVPEIAVTLGVPERTVWDRLAEMIDRLEAVAAPA